MNATLEPALSITKCVLTGGVGRALGAALAAPVLGVFLPQATAAMAAEKTRTPSERAPAWNRARRAERITIGEFRRGTGASQVATVACPVDPSAN